MERILLCTDLDRTLLPNGLQPESPEARPLLRALCARPEITLAYVSGRDRGLLQEAIDQYELPVPDYAIGDVGTTLYTAGNGRWSPWSAWAAEIAPDWAGHVRQELEPMLDPVCRQFDLRLQESGKQGRFKLSYYGPALIDRGALFRSIHASLRPAGVRASLIWSVDETRGQGLLDILPDSADKLHAVRFLMRELGFDEGNTLFSGDSGNDLPVLTSGIPAVLVANATEEVRNDARALLADAPGARLHFARGGFMDMNGNYAAGILEGMNHFFPRVGNWLRSVALKPAGFTSRTLDG